MSSVVDRAKRSRLFRLAGLFLVCTVAAVVAVRVPLPFADFSPGTVQSLRILDRHGIVLRECLNDGAGHARWTPLAAIAPVMVQATVAVEDRRFYRHPGVDPFSIARAVADNIRSGALRSGGSTITQQVIRNVYHDPRTLAGKLHEVWYALRLESMLSKSEILEQYLNRAPYGNQLIGVEAASESYFGKPAKDLSLAEAAFLAGLPNGPTVLNPRRNLAPAMARQHLVLRRLLHQGLITTDECDRALAQPLAILPPESALKAAHVTDMVLARVQSVPAVSVVHTTIDYIVQQRIQQLMRGHVASLADRNVTNASVVVIDNRTGEVRALVGSVDYFDEAHSGQVNGALALRQPGSSIKPLMYTLAFECGFSPADIVADIPTAIPDHEGEYVVENYDRKFHGPVRIRTALACSYNVPAVRVLHAIGTDLFLQRLRNAGITSLTRTPDFYGYGLTLGNGEVSLLELTNAYSALANGGLWKPAVLFRSAETADGTRVDGLFSDDGQGDPRRIYDERAAFLVTDVLSDPVARRPAFGSWFRFPFSCAVKTGTTKDYRDNWTVGYTTEYTVGVWVGNFDGSVMHGVSGVAGAGGIFIDVMNLLHSMPGEPVPGEFKIPSGLTRCSICTVSGQLPGPYCRRTMQEWFRSDRVPSAHCTIHRAYRVRDEAGIWATKVYEVYGMEYSSWVAGERIPVPPPGARRVIEPGPPAASQILAAALSIVAPVNGDVYKLDPVLRREYQTLRVLGSIPDRMRDVRLRVDGSAEVPYQNGGVRWTLAPGAHVFSLVGLLADHLVESRPVTIHVE